jgi:UDP-glucose 4-epimerase
MKNILVIGGAGFIGSHTVVELINADYHPVILDNLDNSERSALDGIKEITGKDVMFYEQDFQDIEALKALLQKEHIDGVIHFAAYKAVGESIEQPLKYYKNNVAGFINLLEVLSEERVTSFVFSSSAAVYGNPPSDQVTEDTPCNPESPYGWSKLMDEIILKDTCGANKQLKGVALRYFNVVGSHESAKIGELPKGRPQNLLPIIVQATAGKIDPLVVYGNDYETPDGTCMRDYVHVVDLAKAHVAALQKILRDTEGSYDVFNIGTGKPTSVLELITTFETINNVTVPYSIGPRRAGDPTSYYAVADKAEKELDWKATKTTEDAVRDAWAWEQNLHKQ